MLRTKKTGFLGAERRLLLLRGALGFAALSCSYYAVVHLPLAEATVIQYTNPIFTALLAALVLGEGLRLRESLLALLSLAGVLLVARPPLLGGDGGSLPLFGVVVALAGALLSAGAYVLVRRLRREDPLVIVFYFAWISALGSLPAVIPVFVIPAGVEWWLLLGVGISTHLGQLSLTHGLRHARAGPATAVGYLQIVLASLWGVLFFSEVPDRWTVLGAGLIVVGTLLLTERAVPAAIVGDRALGAADTHVVSQRRTSPRAEQE
jgi:drug/metabolite transporter (DMT)-like permease